PLPLPLQVFGPRPHAWQPRAQVVTKPVKGVHRPRRPNRADRKAGQLGELCGHQPPDEPSVNVDLAVMHLHLGSPSVVAGDGNRLSASPTLSGRPAWPGATAIPPFPANAARPDRPPSPPSNSPAGCSGCRPSAGTFRSR